MGGARCKAAIDAQALAAGDECKSQIHAFEFQMAQGQFDRLPQQTKDRLADAAIEADEEWIKCCERFCKQYDKVLKATEEALEANES